MESDGCIRTWSARKRVETEWRELGTSVNCMQLVGSDMLLVCLQISCWVYAIGWMLNHRITIRAQTGQSNPDACAVLWTIIPSTGRLWSMMREFHGTMPSFRWNCLAHRAFTIMDTCFCNVGHVDSVFACQFDSMWQRVITGGGQNDKTARIYDAETGTQLHCCEHKYVVTACSIIAVVV